MTVNRKTKEETNKGIKCYMKFTDSFGLLATSIKNLTANLLEKGH